MIPKSIQVNRESLTKLQPSLTQKIDFNKQKLTGTTDNIKAVEQAVFLMLSTERNYSEIYEDFGIKTVDLIGQDFYFVMSELKRRIIDVLTADNRIKDVTNFSFEESREELTVHFDVVTIFGNFKYDYNIKVV